jgi:hypothetical protein
MTPKEFNEKYKDYLEKGHYGLDISYPSIVNYLDKIFQGLIMIPGFQYSQIKLKFNTCRFYNNLYTISPELSNIIDRAVEKEVNFLVTVEDEINERLKEKGE